MPDRRMSFRSGTLRVLGVALVLALSTGCATTRPAGPAELGAMIEFELQQLVDSRDFASFAFPRGVVIDSVQIDSARLLITFSDQLAFRAFRPADTRELYERVSERLRPYVGDRSVELVSLGLPVRELVPNYFRRADLPLDSTRLATRQVRPTAIVQDLDRKSEPANGLAGRNIAVWHSHGWYYEHRLDRWEWQRARLFQTVEDILPMAFVLPYLVPMLENAGAHVFLPRERDTQVNMSIVDNDGSDEGSRFEAGREWQTAAGHGFAIGRPPYPDGVNPFRSGTFVETPASKQATSSVRWLASLPEPGDYAVYISYASIPRGVEDALYEVNHAGGTTRFRVNQQIGGGTWVYLGTFRFRAGAGPDESSVVLYNESSSEDGLVTADAVRFGGGMGVIEREGSTSGRPRFTEAARYHLQFSGMPDTLVFDLNGGAADYRDDYQSRGEWVNYLNGAPAGPNKKRDIPGLGIPIDVSLAFHTDAGHVTPDSTIGTLSIYSVDDADSTRRFPSGASRFANRDLADIVQTQIVEDIRRLYDPKWTRRALWEASYNEAYRPNVPSMLLELLSHHNYADMRFALDPRFRFDASRAIYKGILRFISFQHGVDYAVQPLPVTHVTATLLGVDGVRLSWQPQLDSLEATAAPNRYIVYTRVEDGGFDNGALVDANEFERFGLRDSVIYSFKVTAVNEGGESFPSEILSVCRMPSATTGPVLVVNGFDRIAPPAAIEAGHLTGFAHFIDQGVPDRVDISFTGYQYNFDSRQPWLDDDSPGHGASYADYETERVAGNTFDFPYVHGRSIRYAGYSFVSSSDEALADGDIDPNEYWMVDLILGEERTTGWPRPTRRPVYETFPEPLRRVLTSYAEQGGSLFITGSYVGSDLMTPTPDSVDRKQFAGEVLKMFWRTDHASRRGGVNTLVSDFSPTPVRYRFETELNPLQYAVEAPDGIEPSDSSATLIMRYAENNVGAGIAYDGDHRLVLFGFPFEAVVGESSRNSLMRLVLSFLDRR